MKVNHAPGLEANIANSGNSIDLLHNKPGERAIGVRAIEILLYMPSHPFLPAILFAMMDMTKFKNGRVHFRNSEMTGLMY